MGRPHTKQCSKCGEERELNVEIHPTSSWCKKCHCIYQKSRYAENPNRYREYSKQYRARSGWKRSGMAFAICEQCGMPYQARKDGFMKFCSLECVHESQRKGKYIQCKSCGESRFVPKSKIEKGRGSYCSKKCADTAKIRHTVAQLKLSNRVKCGMLKSIKRGSKAGRHWENLVDYTIDELKAHLEKGFSLGMTWENHGVLWHIDHKIPIAAFNYETPDDIDFKRCWSLTNLRPLPARENMSKGARLECQFQPSLQIAL